MTSAKPRYTLHGPATSPFVRKTWIALKEKQLEFEHRELDPLNKTPRFLEMNPLGRVPILEHAGDFIPDSSAIIDYLEHVHPSPRLYPESPRERARALWLEEYGDTALTQVCARVFWMYVIIPVRSGTPADEAEITAFRNEHFPAVFDYLERIAPEAADGVIEQRFGVADIALAAPVRLLDLAGAPLDAGHWPRFAAYYRRIMGRPSARSIRTAEEAATEVFRTTGNAPT